MTWKKVPEDVYARIFYRELHGSAREGIVLYAMTLGVEVVVGGGTRLALAYLALTALGLSHAWFAGALIWFFVVGSVPYSLFGLAWPRVNHRWVKGVRQPTERELEKLREALEQLRSIAGARGPHRWYVVDAPVPGAFAAGWDIAVSSALLSRETLPSVIAHELGHVETIDARLAIARTGLPLWREPRWAENRADDENCNEPLGPLLLVVSVALRLASGSAGLDLLRPLWNSWAYQREFAADEYTIHFAEHWGLVRFFRELLELGEDTPITRLFASITNHPPTKERIERLEHWGDPDWRSARS